MALGNGDPLKATSVIDRATQIVPEAQKQNTQTQSLRVAEAGEGAEVAVNPLQGLIRDRTIRVPTPEEYDAAAPSPFANAGGSGGYGSDKANALVAEAKKWIGSPYVWGASRPGAFDCSGFIKYIYKQMGIELPRVSYQQMAAGRSVDKSDLQVGDLLGWDYSGRNPGADHIAMYIGNGQIIHTNTPGKPLRIESLASKPQNFAASRIL